MPLKQNERKRMLAELASQLLENPDMELESFLSADSCDALNGDPLSEFERGELSRIQNALTFMRDFDEAAVGINAYKNDSREVAYDETLKECKNKNSKSGSAFTPHDKIGRFEIVELMGSGGFSEVYRAYDPTLNRDVALKVLVSTSRITEEAIVRFQREAQAAGILNHPNIVPVFEQGVVGGQRFIVSELCDGATLKSWFEERNRQVSPTEAAKIVATLAEAVHHAHQRGVIHRDLKPANIMWNGSLNSNAPHQAPLVSGLRITDFGLAKHTAKTDLMETTEGAIVGTPAYMSPEQARGESRIAHGSDIYSLGVILYELLAGRVPISKSTNIDTLLAINNNDIKPPRKLNPNVPRDLESICLNCLKRLPDTRYQDAFALSQDLNAWLDGRPVKARPTSSLEKAWRWNKRNPLLSFAFLFGILSLAIGLAVSTWQWRLTNSHRNRAENKVELLHNTIKNVLDTYSQFESHRLAEPSQKRIVDEMISVHQQLLAEEASQLEVKQEVIAAYIKLCRLYRSMGEYERSSELLTQAQTLLDLTQADTVDEERARLQLQYDFHIESGDLYHAQGLHTDALNHANAAIDALTSLDDEPSPSNEDDRQVDHQHWGRAHRMRAHQLLALDKNDMARNEFQAYHVHAGLLLAEDPENESKQYFYARSLHGLGQTELSCHKLESAIAPLSDALGIFQSLAESDGAPHAYANSIGTLLSDLGYIYDSQGKRMEAKRSYLSSAETLRDALQAFPKDAEILSRLIHVHMRLAKHNRAAKEYENEKAINEAAISLCEKMNPNLMKYRFQTSFSRFHGELLLEHFDSGEEAEELFERTIQLGELALKTYPVDDEIHRSILDAHLLQARVEETKGDTISSQLHVSRAESLVVDYANRQSESPEGAQLLFKFAKTRIASLCEENRFIDARDASNQLAAASPQTSQVRYQIARAMCLIVDKHRRAGFPRDERIEIENQAFDYLAEAIKLGFAEFDSLRSDPEWRAVSASARYKKFLALD